MRPEGKERKIDREKEDRRRRKDRGCIEEER
jgi:hypothetical protein